MRMLFEMDLKDYDGCTGRFVRDSARSIIIRGNRVAMLYNRKYGYYKFPGGGIEDGESPVEAMIRETREEAGFIVVPDTVKEYGLVHRAQRSVIKTDEVFLQDNYYYLCDAEGGIVEQDLDDYEKEEGFTLEFVDPHYAIGKNRKVTDRPYEMMFEREARVLECLIEEGLLV